MANPETHSPPKKSQSANGDPHRKRSFLTENLVSIMLVVTALAVFAVSLYSPVRSALRTFADTLSPLLIGAVIAYLCDPILTFFEYRFFGRMKKGSLRRGLSLLCTVLTVLGFLTLIGFIIIPQLYFSLAKFIGNADLYVNNLARWLEGILAKLSIHVDLDAMLSNDANAADSTLQKLLDKLGPYITGGDISGKLWKLVNILFNTFKNLLLGMVIAFYMLASKEKRIAQLGKARAALLSEKSDRRLSRIVSLADNTFGSFIYGKLLDSFVICVLTFAMLSIFDISEFNLLIAVIVGIANIIPVFGPFIGAVPAFFIVLVSAPSNTILFLVLILIIQQLDGNVLAPKILGDNTGISSLCVLVAISVCSVLWGIAGMIIGVPVFAVIIELVRRILEDRLRARGAPTDTPDYYPNDAVGNAVEDVYYEHTHLKYRYERSRIKPVMDRLRSRMFVAPARRANRKKQSGQGPPPSDDPPPS